MTQRYETYTLKRTVFRVLTRPGDDQTIERWLGEMAHDGWDFVSSAYAGDLDQGCPTHRYVFKREIR